jgi:asparagine synthase (glutamine-hydrolysing)
MCGISAIFRKDSSSRVDPEELRSMSSVISHRGPDDAGFAMLDRGRLGLAQVRLSILDHGMGMQPMFSADGVLTIVFNGEIYDHESHRQSLLKDGHRLRTHSDTEVILGLYERHGLDLFSHLNGEFAFLLWDSRKRRLLAARDRFGVKPLQYLENGNEYIFCSEAKGILSLPRVERSVSPHYLIGPWMGAFRNDITPFSGISHIKPGHFLLIDHQGEKQETRYWRNEYSSDSKMSFEEAKEGVAYHLRAAVKRRMVADVPVATYLSGGIDSALVCGIMAQEGTKRPSAFNLSFAHSIYDESTQATQIAGHFGAELEIVPCSNSDIARNLTATLYHTEVPLTNPSAAGKFVLSRALRDAGHKVSITGEGADEIFAGYANYKLETLWRMSLDPTQNPDELRQLQSRFFEIDTRSEGILWNRSNRWKKLIPLFGFPSFFQQRSAESEKIGRIIFNRGFMPRTSEMSPLYTMATHFDLNWLQSLDPIQASLVLAQSQLHQIVIPTMGDRVEMAHSIEGRTPFLDRDLVEFASKIPPRFFIDMKTLHEKHVLREAFKDFVPPFMRKEHKNPFFSPDWMSIYATPEGKELFHAHYSAPALEKAGIFRPFVLTSVLALMSRLPSGSQLRKRLNLLVGHSFTLQILHDQLIAKRPQGAPGFSMREMRSDIAD